VLLFQDMGIDYQQLIDISNSTYNKDSTDNNTLRTLFMLYYLKGDYNTALKYHHKLVENNSITIFDAGRVAFILSEMGKEELSEEYSNRYFNYLNNNLNTFHDYHHWLEEILN